MNRLEINPNNEKYYSKEFMQGYKCGIRCQFYDDAKVLEQISDEVNKLKKVSDGNKVYVGINDVFDIIDNYR